MEKTDSIDKLREYIKKQDSEIEKLRAENRQLKLRLEESEAKEKDWYAIDAKKISISLTELKISNRTNHILNRAGIYTIGDFLKRNYQERMSIRNWGPSLDNVVIDKISEFGLPIN